jgi:hypothetical protein
VDCDPPHSHHGCVLEHQLKLENRQKLVNCTSNFQFWQLIRKWTDVKPKPTQVTADELNIIFSAQLNPHLEMPQLFDAERHHYNAHFLSALPDHTIDYTPQHFFSTPFTAEEVEWAKVKIKKHRANSACGLDGVAYNKISEIPNVILVNLFNKCISQLDAPHMWLMTELVGILKTGIPIILATLFTLLISGNE